MQNSAENRDLRQQARTTAPPRTQGATLDKHASARQPYLLKLIETEGAVNRPFTTPPQALPAGRHTSDGPTHPSTEEGNACCKDQGYLFGWRSVGLCPRLQVVIKPRDDPRPLVANRGGRLRDMALSPVVHQRGCLAGANHRVVHAHCAGKAGGGHVQIAMQEQ